MPRERKHVKKDEIFDYVSDRGARLEFYRPSGVFSIHSRHDDNKWVWVINPYTQERVRRVRELDKDAWITALENAFERLQSATSTRATQEK